jgi:hypothetical protein
MQPVDMLVCLLGRSVGQSWVLHLQRVLLVPGAHGHVSLSNIITKLKKACNHPFLFESAVDECRWGKWSCCLTVRCGVLRHHSFPVGHCRCTCMHMCRHASSAEHTCCTYLAVGLLSWCGMARLSDEHTSVVDHLCAPVARWCCWTS